MKTFLIKHKSAILYWLIFSGIILIFVPRQKAYYLQADVDTFQDKYLMPGLFWIWGVICVLFLLLLFINTRSIKNSVISFLYTSLIAACLLFIFKDIFLGGALFVNKLYTRGNAQKVYSVVHINSEEDKTSFILLDVATNRSAYDEMLEEKLYQPNLKLKDTVKLPVTVGLLGIAYPSE